MLDDASNRRRPVGVEKDYPECSCREIDAREILSWVEFRGSIDDSDAFHRLVCGIRGVMPGLGESDVRGSPRTPHNLPFAPNPAFTGREAELRVNRDPETFEEKFLEAAA
jgi:hypothetical protein